MAWREETARTNYELDRCQTIIWPRNNQSEINERVRTFSHCRSSRPFFYLYNQKVNTTNEIDLDDDVDRRDDGNVKTDVDHDYENLRSDVGRRRLCVS